MRKLTFEILVAVALTLAAIVTSVPGALAGDLVVKDAFARASATAQATSGVVYATLVNDTDVADRLVGVETPVAGMAMLHESKTDGQTETMAAVAALDIPAGASVTLKPGGYHVMLMGLKAPLKKGEHIAVTFIFEKAGRIEISLPVAGVAAQTPPDSSGG
jgi:copper(I)-binding protein